MRAPPSPRGGLRMLGFELTLMTAHGAASVGRVARWGDPARSRMARAMEGAALILGPAQFITYVVTT
jgi:voltage-gated potassium channel